MKNKTAQVEGTVIIYVLAVFIASLVLIFGYTVIQNLTESTRNIELLQFKQDVQNQVRIKSSEFQSRDTLTLSLPSSFDKICFSSYGSSTASSNADAERLTLVSFLLRQNPATEQNVFLLEKNILKDAFNVNKLSLHDGQKDADFLCYNIVDGQVRLTFIARGRAGVNIISDQ